MGGFTLSVMYESKNINMKSRIRVLSRAVLISRLISGQVCELSVFQVN